MADSSGSAGLGKAALKYTGLRLACVLGAFAVACLVVVPIHGSVQESYFIAALIGIAASIPLSYWLGRDLREQVANGMLASRVERQAKVDDWNARVKAVEDAKKAGSEES